MRVNVKTAIRVDVYTKGRTPGREELRYSACTHKCP